MAGKILPYIAVGFAQAAIILLAAKLLFDVPMLGSVPLLLGAMTLYIAALLALGFTISTVARSQLQAMQMTFFFFLPSLLLSGFMFPFRGMPGWAQALGEVFPLTHFLRVVRGVLLKGNGWDETAPHLWPIAAFLAVVAVVALLRYRRTLD
jgi:ABC-2 type transport system permease protein